MKSFPKHGFEPNMPADEWSLSLIKENSDKFTQDIYSDEHTGLSVKYNIFLPDGYDGEKLPMIVFIGDASLVSKDVIVPIKYTADGVIWASDSEQQKHKSIVVVPCYETVVLDDHNGFYKSEYLELTARMIISLAERYNADQSRIYGTGQSMGAMMALYLASQHPDHYAAVLIVDGQWDISDLADLPATKFTYIAAKGDKKAYGGLAEVKQMLDSRNISYGTLEDIDAKADRQESDHLAKKMYSEGHSHNFITFKEGSVLDDPNEHEHMASFKYGYKIDAVRDWLFEQTK